VGRVELLAWLNDFLKLDYKKIEQTASAVAYLQLMDALYPGKVPLTKVNWGAKFDYEFIKNFTLLQQVFDKVGLEKKIDVPVLVKGKFQDNLEFCQWMKKFFDVHYGGDPYDAVGKREAAIKSQGGKPASAAPAKKATAAAASPVKPATKASSPATTGVKKATAAPAAKAAAAASPAKPKETAAPASTGKTQRETQLEAQVEELTLVVSETETEREFYFGKLRQIELACQQVEADSPLSKRIFQILTSESAEEEEVGDVGDQVETEELEAELAEEVVEDDETF